MDTDEHGSDGFPGTLSTLKSNGANVLVVGTVPDDVRLRASRQLLGAPEGPPRRRILAFTGYDATSVDQRLPARSSRDPDHLQVVVDDVDVRSAVPEPGGDAAGTDPAITRIASGDLSEFGTALTDAIDDLDEVAEGLDPAELRLCLDSVAALIDRHDRSSVLVLLHLLTERVNRVDGIGHYHLPVDRDAELVSTFVPLVDVTVALRVRDGRAEQRWHLADGTSSEWLPLAK